MVIALRIFVRAGAEWMWGGDPCGRPGGLAQQGGCGVDVRWDPCGRPGGALAQQPCLLLDDK